MIRATLLSTTCAWLICAISLFPGSVAAQQGEAAVLKRAAELRDAPADSGRSLAALPAQEPVVRMGSRQGGWIQVQTRSGIAGWVHMFDVGPAGLGGGAATGTPSGGNVVTGGLRGISNMLGGGSALPPPRVSTSTIGIRGLEAEDLARAQPNMNAVTQMEQMRQDEASARQFAADAALAAVTVPTLSAPARVSSPQGGGNQSTQ